MFGTVAHIRPKVGQEKAVMAMLEDWDRERRPKVKGALEGYLFKPVNNPNELIMVAIFQDRESYVANANDPEQDRWYRRLRDLLEADPVWEDGEVIRTSTMRTPEGESDTVNA